MLGASGLVILGDDGEVTAGVISDGTNVVVVLVLSSSAAIGAEVGTGVLDGAGTEEDTAGFVVGGGEFVVLFLLLPLPGGGKYIGGKGCDVAAGSMGAKIDGAP